jgi:hypothetical protein
MSAAMTPWRRSFGSMKKQVIDQTGAASTGLQIGERSRPGVAARGATAHQPIGRSPS